MPSPRQRVRPARKTPPHPFVLKTLAPLEPEVRRLFSGYAVYVGDRIVCMLRDHAKSPQDNGVWLVLSESVNPGDKALRQEFPSLRPIEMLGSKISHWLVIPSDSPTFEEEALHACDRLLHHDARFGRVPKSHR